MTRDKATIKSLQDELAECQKYHRYLSDLASNLISCPVAEIDGTIEQALATIGDLAGVDRAYVFQMGEDGSTASNTHEWCAPGIEPQIENLQNVPVASIPWWMSRLERLEVIVVPRVDRLPPEAAPEKRILEDQDIQSVVFAPMIRGGHRAGFVGLDAVREPRIWSDRLQGQIKLLGRILSHALGRKRAEEALLDSESKLRTFVDAVQGPAFLIDRDRRVAMANADIARRLGCTVSELVGSVLPDYVEGEVGAIRKRATDKVFASGQAAHFEDSRRGRHYGNHFYPILDASGTVSHVAVVARDITERKLAELALAESEAKLRAFVDAIQGPAFLIDRDYRVVVANETIARRLGCTVSALVGSVVLEHLEPDVAATRKRVIGQVMVSGRAAHCEDSRRGRHYINHCYPVFDASGAVSHVALVATDITERKLAELALMECETSWTQAQEVAHLGGWTWDLQTKTVRWPEQLYRLMGLPPEEQPLSYELCRSRVHPEDRERKLDEFAKTLWEQGRAMVVFRTVPIDGQTRIIRAIGEMLYDEDGAPLRVVGLDQDISDLERLESQLAQASKMKAIATLAGEVAHDFGHILTVMNAYNELLLQTLDMDASGRVHAQGLHNAWQQAVRLVRQLQALSRQQVMEPEIMCLDMLVQEARDHLRQLLPDAAQMRLDLGAREQRVRIDSSQMLQVLMNLVANAGEAIVATSERGRVTIETTELCLDKPKHGYDRQIQPGHYVRLTIRDTGVGMGDDTKERLFEPYFSTKEKKSRGLGMAIVYGIVKQHAGSLAINSDLGHGTAVSIYLPVVE